MIGTTVKMDSLKEDFSDSQFAEKIKSLSHEISKGLKKLVEEGYEETESEEETAGEITASEVAVAVVEENEFLESGTEEEKVAKEELVELQAKETGANEEARAKIGVLNQKLLQFKEEVNRLEARIETFQKESAAIVSKELEKKMAAFDSALKSKINVMDKDLLRSNEKIRN